MRIQIPSPALAARQAEWIVELEPWRSLGYRSQPLGRYLGRLARAGQALVATEGARVRGIVVYQPDFLLGYFVGLLAVCPDAAGHGVGRGLMARVERLALPRKRWLWVSSDAANVSAARFYRKLGFRRVARLPDLIAEGHTEILWRKGAARGRDAAAHRSTK
jgi:ribosomal protein S18 acetylase RimI-like enzyme